MILEVTEKEQNKRLVTEQKEGPFKSWTFRQEFNQSNGQGTHIRHVFDYELPTTGKIAKFLQEIRQRIKYNKVYSKQHKQ